MFSGESSRSPSGAAKTRFTVGAFAISPVPGKFASSVFRASIAGVPEIANSEVKGFDRVNAAPAVPAKMSSQAMMTCHLCRYDQRPT